MENNKYVQGIESAKLAARDILRAKWIMNRLPVIKGYEEGLKLLAEDAKRNEKFIAISKFLVDQATKNGDPRLEDLTKQLDEDVETYEETKKNIEEEIKHCEKHIADEKQLIEDITNGVKKVSYDNMMKLAKEIMEDQHKHRFTTATTPVVE